VGNDVCVANSDRVQAAADQLYAADPAEFTDRRSDLVAQARADGDKAAAREIGALRRPTRAAWVVNQLARSDPDAVDQLTGLGDELRAAESALDGGRLRELSQARRELLAALTRQALAVVDDPPDALQQEVTGTLGAAVADPRVAAEVASGRLAKAVQSAGFGFGLAADTDADAATAGPEQASDAPSPPSAPAPAAAAKGRPAVSAPPRLAPSRTRVSRADRERDRAEQKRAAAERADRERAERARAELERQRRAIGEAEQTLAEADHAVDAAHAAEADRERAVRQLEEQLEDAQDALADAKRRSRDARTAQRQARKALDRLRDRVNGLPKPVTRNDDVSGSLGSWQTRSP
jgi:DNA repair exonuclease SbcCD ATPase subunit